jgi:hypothetical protein
LIIIELIYCFFSLYYTWKIGKNLLRYWDKFTLLEPKLEVPPKSGKFVRAVLYIGIDYQSFQDKSAVIIIFRIILGILFFIIRQIIKAIRVVYKQLTDSVFTSIDLI